MKRDRRSEPKADEITDETAFVDRRTFIRAGLLAGSVAATGLSYKYFNTPQEAPVSSGEVLDLTGPRTYDPGETVNSLEDITNYNNFYEFATDKRTVAAKSTRLVTRPWTIEVDGSVHRPAVFGIEDLLKFDQEERIYRFRCVEAWSMVIPWIGFPLKRLLDRVEPLGSAAYVAFQSMYDPGVMQSSFSAGIDFPYVEGLRLDEALHPLTILATGIYGKEMPKQNGAPIRLVVPWKYGFKSIKSIVRITLTDAEPPTTWNIAAPDEYGFYSNVNPTVAHPRWSQVTERRIGELGLRDTLPFNGYADEVAGLYAGMDLRKYF